MERIKYLVSLIAQLGAKMEITKNYSDEFLKTSNKYLSPTETIKMENLTDYFVDAGIVSREEILPILTENGGESTEFTPDIIGGQYPYSAQDLIALNAGVPTITPDGTEIQTIDQLEAKLAKKLASARFNKFEKQCADLILKGTYTDYRGKVFVTGVKAPAGLDWSKTENYIDELISLIGEYQHQHSIAPIVKVGKNIFNALKNEGKDANNNIDGVKFTMQGGKMKLVIGELVVEMLSNAKGTDGKTIGTDNLIILNAPSNIGVGYGCLTYGDVKTNETKLVRAEFIAGETRVSETTGSKTMYIKSAPMPLILSTKKFKKYSVTLGE